jgi:DNA-binding MarR family transcriptional regulator
MCAKLDQKLYRTKPFESPEQEAFLSLMVTADQMLFDLNRLLKEKGLSEPLYNVLRILRGAEPGGLHCGDIATRLVSHQPDVTRLLDRLDKKGLVTRERIEEDRRVVTVSITDSGLKALKTLDGPVAKLHRRQFAALSGKKLRKLVGTLELLREAPK